LLLAGFPDGLCTTELVGNYLVYWLLYLLQGCYLCFPLALASDLVLDFGHLRGIKEVWKYKKIGSLL
jgi:hypothetical protein